MFAIAVIKPNNFIFEYEIYFNNKEKLKTDIESVIFFVNTDNDSLTYEIVEHIEMSNTIMGETQVCYENEQNVYQLCYRENKSGNINNIATFLIDNGDIVNNNGVFICSKIDKLSNQCVTNTCCLDDIVNILYAKFVHKGVIVEDDVSEYEFKINPLDDVINKEVFAFSQMQIYNFNLAVFYKKTADSDDKINKLATRLTGGLIYGIVYMVSLVSEQDVKFDDLSKVTFCKLLDNSYGPICYRDLDGSEVIDGTKVNNLPVVMNKYCILDNRNKNKRYICECCRKKLVSTNKIIVCSGCFRYRYDSDDCHKYDWQYHKDDCLYNKKPINKNIA